MPNKKWRRLNPEKHKEAMRRANKKYRDKNKEKIRAYQKQYRKKNRESIRQRNREYVKKLKRQIDQILGTKCVICGSTERLRCHEIYGKPHIYNLYYVINHSEDFVRMCEFCHKFVHNIARNSNKPLNITKLKYLLNVMA